MSSTIDLQVVLKRRVKALESHLPGAFAGDPRALHRARVASRRLREVLPLMSTAGLKTKRRVRRLTAWLGRVREMDVALSLLGSEQLTRGLSRSTLAEVRQGLQIAREKRREKMLRRFETLKPEKLGRMLGRLVDDASHEDGNAWRRALAARLATRTNALRRAVDQAGAIYVAERLHGVRIAAKKLRYALEIAAELGQADAARPAAIIRRTQVTLGNLQDRHMLLRQVHSTADGTDTAARQGLAALESELEASCRELHAQFLSQRGPLAAALVAVRQQVVPGLAHSAQRRTALKATTATITHGRSHRALSDSTRPRRATRRRLA